MTTWDNIKVFYLVIKQKSFSKAAEILDIHVSTISRKINNLEKKIGYSLFNSRNPLILSDMGIRLMDYIKTSCNQLFSLEEIPLEILHEKEKLKFYVNDIYFFHLLYNLYDCHTIKKFIDMNDVSVVDENFISNLINTKKDNFIYIVSDEYFLKQIQNNPNYISWSIYNLQICLYEKENHNNFIFYTGGEKWLMHLHEKFTQKHNISKNNIIFSNSIDIIFNLIQCGGKSILPNILEKKNLTNINILPMTYHNLFVLCHVSDVFLRVLF